MLSKSNIPNPSRKRGTKESLSVFKHVMSVPKTPEKGDEKAEKIGGNPNEQLYCLHSSKPFELSAIVKTLNFF